MWITIMGNDEAERGILGVLVYTGFVDIYHKILLVFLLLVIANDILQLE